MDKDQEPWRDALRETILNMRGAIGEMETAYARALERLEELESSLSDGRDFTVHQLKR